MAPVLESISVLIPTLGRPLLRECVEAIAAGSAWPARLIVVDQSDGRHVNNLIVNLNARGIASERLELTVQRRACAVNRGLERVRTAFVAVTDDDCLVGETWLNAIVTRLTQDPQVIVTGPMDPAGPEPVVSARTSRRPIVQRRPPVIGVELLIGGNMGASLRAIERIGPFDEDPRVAVAEDRAWGYRALRAGVPIAYCPEVVVRHVGWRNVAERATQYRAYGRSLGAFYGKGVRRGDALLSVRYVLHLGYAIGKVVSGWLLRKPELRLSGTAVFRGMILGLVAGLRTSRHPGPGPLRLQLPPPSEAAREIGVPLD